MSENEAKLTVEELLDWLKKSSGDWAGVYARDGVIGTYDVETGETIAEIEVETHISNKTSIAFKGDDPTKVHKASEAFYIDLIDGGLDQSIEGRLNSLGHNISIDNFEDSTMTQWYLVE